MAVTPRATWPFLVALLLLGCESDEAKLTRLEQDAAIARSEVRRLEDASHRIVLPTLEARQARAAALTDSLDRARTQSALADRALNRFMAGR